MKKKRKRKTLFALAIITLVVMAFIIFSLIPGSPIHSVTGPISFLTDPIQKFAGGVIDNVGGFVSSVKDAEKIRKENIKLQNENTALKLKVKELEENGRRWEELKEAFLIKEIFSDYNIIGASVLNRALGEWFDVFRIDAGTKRGITIDRDTSYAVLDASMNLVGRVYSSDLTSSKILPILNEGSIINAKVNTPGGSLMRVKGDILLKEDGLCLIDNISEFSSIHVGDEVLTSGLGGLFPAGIPIGVIKEIKDEAYNAERIAILEVYADYKMLKDVFIMKGDLDIE